MTKPFNSKELDVRIRNLIALRRALHERYQKNDGLLKPDNISVTSVEEAFLKKMMGVIEAHIEDENFGVETLGEALHIGRRQLHRKIKAITGESPNAVIRSVRLHRAKQLLEQKAGTVTEVAFRIGFNSLPYFSKTFKEKFGKLPSEI